MGANMYIQSVAILSQFPSFSDSKICKPTPIAGFKQPASVSTNTSSVVCQESPEVQPCDDQPDSDQWIIGQLSLRVHLDVDEQAEYERPEGLKCAGLILLRKSLRPSTKCVSFKFPEQPRSQQLYRPPALPR